MTIGRIKTFRLAYVLERMIYFRIDGPEIEFGFIIVYLSFNRFYGASIHLLGLLSLHIHRAKTCSFISFDSDRMAVFVYLPYMVFKLGIAGLQFSQMHMVWIFATMSDKSIRDCREVLVSLAK